MVLKQNDIIFDTCSIYQRGDRRKHWKSRQSKQPAPDVFPETQENQELSRPHVTTDKFLPLPPLLFS